MDNYKIVRADSHKTTIWSGGTTTELYIHPENASLSERTFDFRISTAEVIQENSDFSFFLGYDRHIMILSGEVELSFENNVTERLLPFEKCFFSGEWHTKSAGSCIDFNLILRKGGEGGINPVCSGTYETGGFFSAFYFLKDGVTMRLADMTEKLYKGDLLIFHKSATLGEVEINGGTCDEIGVMAFVK